MNNNLDKKLIDIVSALAQYIETVDISKNENGMNFKENRTKENDK